MTALAMKVELTKKMEYAKSQLELWGRTVIHANRESAKWVSYWEGKRDAYQDALKLLDS